LWYSPKDGKEEHNNHKCKVEIQPEEADDEVTKRHSTYSGKRALNIGRCKQTQDEHHRILGIAEPKLDHVSETAAKQSINKWMHCRLIFFTLPL